MLTRAGIEAGRPKMAMQIAATRAAYHRALKAAVAGVAPLLKEYEEWEASVSGAAAKSVVAEVADLAQVSNRAGRERIARTVRSAARGHHQCAITHVQEIARDRGELYGGARINHLFRVEYFDELQNVDACAGLSDADISHAIRQATGPRAPLFVPGVAFEVLTRRQVAQLRPYALRAVEQVLAEMQAMVSACMPKQAARFSTLQKRITQCATRLLARHAAPTNSMVASLVDMELAYLNTSHPDFVGGGQAMRLVAQQMHSSANTRFQSAEMPINPFSESSTAKHGSVNSASGGASSLDLARPPELPQVEPRRSNSVGDESSSFLNSFFGNGRSRSSAVTAALAPPPAPTVGLSSCASGDVRGDGAGGSNSSLADSYAERHNGHFHCTPRTAPSREHLEAEIIRSLLVSYFGIVRKNLQDLVPKAIMHFLVNAARSEMQNNLVAELYREHELDSMFAEAEEATYTQ
uniref:GED domain-containing protein n=2 Tax=Chrysotila carterae TaxID=13221 RepID=A0A7S4BXD0_CHRCT